MFGAHLPAGYIYDPFDPNQRPDDDPSGGAGQQHIVPGVGGDRIPPPVGPQGMEDGNIGSDRLSHYYLSARIERIVLDEQIGAIGQLDRPPVPLAGFAVRAGLCYEGRGL